MFCVENLWEVCRWELRIKGTGLTKITEPWISGGMLKSVNRKNKLYQQYLRPLGLRWLHFS